MARVPFMLLVLLLVHSVLAMQLQSLQRPLYDLQTASVRSTVAFSGGIECVSIRS